MTKQHLRLVAPTTEKRTVPPGGSEVTATTLPTRQPNSAYRTREHLTEAEVEKLIGGRPRTTAGATATPP